MQSILALAAAVVAFFSLSLLVAAAAALAYGDWHAVEAFVLTGVVYGFLSSVTIMTLMPRLRRLNRVGVFRAAMAMWCALCLAAVTPFLLVENLPPVPALFEAVSAAVTLGTTFRPVADMTPAMIFYRGLVAWQGGLLTLLTAVYVLGYYQVGGTPNRHLRYILHSLQSGDQRIVWTFFEVFVPYAALTLVCAAALVVVQVGPADALNLALNISATNGFVPVQTGASVLNNVAGEIVLMVFMVLSATSIIWHRALTSRKWQHAGEQPEVLMYLVSIGVVAAIAAMVAVTVYGGRLAPGAAVLNAVFDVVSTMTTTGITHDQRLESVLPFEFLLAVTFLGGCSYSTAGGLKVFRLRSMLHHSANEIRKLVYPHIVLAGSVHDSPMELRLAKAVWSAFYLAIIAIVCSTLALSFQGVGLTAGLAMAVGAFSSTASFVSTNAGTAPGEGVMMTIAATGLAARMELLVVLAALQRTG